MKGNRSALWALLGVLVGFGLPVLACVGITFAFSLSLTALGDAPGDTGPVQVHVSGPIAGPAVAIIDVEGAIVSGEAPLFSNTAVAAADDVIALIRSAAIDSEVRAIVLDVNSPGGSVVPSDEIYHALEELQIPVVVYMGDLAASGAYYLSMSADHIVANPSTLTGSIGVISTFPNAEELLDKVGIQITVITAGESKDFGSPYRPLEADERAYWEGILEETHQRFIEIVAEGRDLPVEEVTDLADGRVFSGRQALELDLVDELGYREGAIEVAADLGAIDGEPRVVRFRTFTPFSSLLGQSLAAGGLDVPIEWLQRILGPTLEYRWLP